MKTFTVQIINMVCPRCIHVVKQILSDLGIQYNKVELGYAVLNAEQSLDLEIVNQKLEVLDLGLVRDSNEVIVTEINKAIHAYFEDISLLSQKLKLSEYIARQLARNYHQLSKVYSQHQGKTIEQYFIELRTNTVKELIKQGKLNLSQIAINVGYSSIHYLSGQFKKFTGISLTQYKKEWEASLKEPGQNDEDTQGASSDGRVTECDCECENCDCQGVNGPLRGDNNLLSPGTIIGEREVAAQTVPFPSQNFGEYRVHISA